MLTVLQHERGRAAIPAGVKPHLSTAGLSYFYSEGSFELDVPDVGSVRLVIKPPVIRYEEGGLTWLKTDEMTE